MAQEMKNGATFGTAWRNNMNSCTDATRRMVVECRRGGNDISTLASNMERSGASAKAAAIGFNILKTAANVLLVVGITELISGIYQFVQASKDIANSAQEIGSKFKDTEKDISSYKKKVEELQGTINDSSSSIDDVADAREELMKIQDELIEKYGTEEASIKNITDAVNGQAKAWENLTRQQWIDAKNDFNNKSKNGIVKNFSNFIHGYKSNIDRMKKEFGEYSVDINAGSITGKENRRQVEEILSKFGKLTPNGTYGNLKQLTLKGNATEVYNQLLKIQSVFNSLNNESIGKNSSFVNDLGDMAESAKEASEKYKDFWNEYLLNDKILTQGSKYSSSYKNILDDYDKYQEAANSKDKKRTKEAKQTLVESISGVMDDALKNGDKDVVSYFENMYPELKAEVDSWRFDIKFEANKDNLKDQVKTDLEKLKGFSTEDLKEDTFNPNAVTKEQAAAYNDLIGLADNYGLSIDELIEKFQKLGLVQPKAYQELVNKFGKVKVNKLSKKDLEIAYTIPNVSLLSWDELLKKIKQVKKEASEQKNIPQSFNSAWGELDDSTKNSLLELAEAGNLTKETFLKVEGSSDFLTKLGLSEKDIDKVINKINKLVDNSKQLSTMRSGISSITSAYDEKKDSKYNTVSASTLSSMYDTLGIKEWDKENIKAWENYKEIAGDSAQSLSSLTKAQNKLASAYVNSHDFLSGLTKETQDYYEAQLTEMGVTNAHEVTTQVLANKMQYLAEQKAYAKKEGEELSKASTKNLKNFIDEQGGANKVSAALFNLAVNKEMVNNHALNFDGDVSNLLSYVEAIEGANKALNALKALKAIQHDDYDTAAKLGYHYMDTSSMSKLVGDAKKEVNKAKNKLKTNTTKVNPTVSLGNKNNSSKDSSNKSKSKDKTKPTAQIFDFIERRINKLTKTIDYAKAKIEALFTVKAKNSQLDTALKNTTNLINAQKKAANKYQAYADKLAKNATKGKKGLKQSEVNKYIKLIENGSLTKEAISSIKNEKLKTFIENYQTYYDKAQEAKKAVQDNIASIVELNKQKLDNITSYYDALISKIDATTSKLEAQISLQKSVNSVYGKGEIGSADTYDKVISNTSSDITQYKSEKKTYDSTRKSARNKLKKELKKNGVSKSERKAALVQFDAETKAQIENFNTSIFNAESKLYEYAQSLASLPWDKASAKVDKLSSSYDVLNAKLANGTSVTDKNKILDQMNGNLDSQLSQKKSALTNDNKNIKDTAKWLNKNTKTKVKSGKLISLEDLNAIKKKYGNNSKQYAKAIAYNSYVDKRDTDKLDYDKSVEENKSNKAENAKTKFTNIQNDYQRKLDTISNSADSLNNQMSILEAKGYKITANYYQQLANNSQKTINEATKEKEALQASLNESLVNGTIQKGTDAYYEMIDAINTVTKSIDEATLSQTQYLQKVRETNREIEKSARDAISNLNDEAEFYKDILAYEELYDDNGNLNDAGKATMQLSMVEMSDYIALNNKLKQSIADLDQQYADGKMGFDEYYTQKQTLLSEQRDAIKGYYSECDAIKTLIENGYNAQKEALSDLISKYTEALDAEKNLHDYEKNIKEKTENIDSIKKRIAALQGNDTEEARQKIQKLTIDLKSAQEDLEETQYEQYLSDQKDILDDLQNDYQTFVEEQLKNVQDLINALITDANTNTGAVIDKLDNIAKLWGTDFENNKLKESLETASFGSETNQDANAVKVAEKVYDKFKDDLSEPPTTILAQPPSNDTTANNNNDSEDPDTNSHIKKQQEEEKTKDDIKDKEEKEAENKTHSGAIINSDNFKSDKQKEKESLKKIIKNYTGSSDDTNKPLRKVKKGETSKSALNKKLSADYGVVVKSGAGNHGQKYIDMFAKAVGLVGSNGGYGENDEVYQQLKKKYQHLGFSTGGVVGELNKVATDNGDDGWITVKTKERVLTARQNNLWEKWTKNLPELVNIADYLPSMSEYMPKIPDMATNMRVQNGGNSVNVGDISYTMEFPNVTDAASMKEAIKQDTSLQNLMRDVTIGQMKKGNKLGMMKY